MRRLTGHLAAMTFVAGMPAVALAQPAVDSRQHAHANQAQPPTGHSGAARHDTRPDQHPSGCECCCCRMMMQRHPDGAPQAAPQSQGDEHRAHPQHSD